MCTKTLSQIWQSQTFALRLDQIIEVGSNRHVAVRTSGLR